MHFERLRLAGFKSFVDPTEVVIGPGLTGVVGPNGCGKSNLLEALRWVMGESSYKSMRASGMDDVIFAGSAERPARNSAEVTLLLDNSGRTAPAAFNGDERIEVNRRIEREAGSIYRVNGKDVRARDVQLLFADASTGARSPSLVRQGQIGELVSAKPQARRRILEEAAGIAGLHARRHEADLRLNAAETNLQRLDDVIAALEGQLAALKRQARQARRYRRLSAELRAGEGLRLYLRWREAADAVAAEEARYAEVQVRLGELTRAAAAASAAQTTAAAELPGLREGEAAAAAALRRLEIERDGLDAEARRAEARMSELEARLRQIADDAGRERESAGETEAILARLAEEEHELAQAGGDHEAAVATARGTLEEARAALEAAEGRLEESSRQAARLASERAGLERALAEREARHARLEAEGDRIAQELAALEAKEPAPKELEELTAAVAEAAARLEAADANTLEADRALADAREAEARARREGERAEREAQRVETEIATLRKVLSTADDDLWPPLVDAVSVEPGYEAALGAALGDDLDASTDGAAPVHWRALGDLDETPALPEGAEPLSRRVRAPEVLARRLSQIGVVADEGGAALQERLAPGQRLVSKAGALWRWDGFTTAADAPASAAHRLAERNRLKSLEEEARALRADASEKAGAIAEAEAALKAAEARAETGRNAWRDVNRALGAARDALAAGEREASESMSRLSALAETRARLGRECEQALAERAAAAETLAAAQAPESLETTLASLREEVAGARVRHAETHAAAETLSARAQQRERRLADIADERKIWRERGARAEAQLETLAAREREARAEVETLAGVPADVEARRVRLMEAIGEAEMARKGAADALAQAETALAEADRAARGTQARLAEAREDAARLEARLEAGRGRMSEFGAELGETLGCAPDAALDALGLDADAALPAAEEIERRIARLRAERERLGGVNLRAEEEADELGEKLAGLGGERDDLIAAIERLRQGIARLNREGRKRLLEAFDQVNANFEGLFVKLFGGGKARLELTDSDDPLEAGLEIMARPPGKRLQVISLLSGGEKALTACALIFAIFLTNPSPVCVLDEVDAPLDDSNVERFCALLDEMRRQTDTRFIIITHHPYTMARMNRLFGVTMAERGVSQIVSVDLEEAVRLREAG